MKSTLCGLFIIMNKKQVHKKSGRIAGQRDFLLSRDAASFLFLYMIQPLGQDGGHMGVCQGIVNGFSVPAELYKRHLFQYPELVGNCALGHPQQLGDIADAQLAGRERVKNPDPGRVSEYLEKVCQTVEYLIIRHRSRYRTSLSDPGEG